MHDVFQKIRDVCQRINRDPATIRVLAAIKDQPDQKVIEIIGKGVRIVGENQVQHAIERSISFKEMGCEYHFIGGIQSNKLRRIINKFDVIQTLDKYEHASKIQSICETQSKIMPCYIEINIQNNPNRRGLLENLVINFAKLIIQYNNIRVLGIMTLAPFFDDIEKTRPYFKKMAKINQDLKNCLGNKYGGLLSMGMSRDFEIAIEEGADLVRIGQAFFGQRTNPN